MFCQHVRCSLFILALMAIMTSEPWNPGNFSVPSGDFMAITSWSSGGDGTCRGIAPTVPAALWAMWRWRPARGSSTFGSCAKCVVSSRCRGKLNRARWFFTCSPCPRRWAACGMALSRCRNSSVRVPRLALSCKAGTSIDLMANPEPARAVQWASQWMKMTLGLSWGWSQVHSLREEPQRKIRKQRMGMSLSWKMMRRSGMGLSVPKLESTIGPAFWMLAYQRGDVNNMLVCLLSRDLSLYFAKRHLILNLCAFLLQVFWPLLGNRPASLSTIPWLKSIFELAQSIKKTSNHWCSYMWDIRHWCSAPRSSSGGSDGPHYRSVLGSTAKAFQRFDAGEAVNFIFVLHGPRQLLLSPREDVEDPEEEPETDDEAEGWAMACWSALSCQGKLRHKTVISQVLLEYGFIQMSLVQFPGAFGEARGSRSWTPNCVETGARSVTNFRELPTVGRTGRSVSEWSSKIFLQEKLLNDFWSTLEWRCSLQSQVGSWMIHREVKWKHSVPWPWVPWEFADSCEFKNGGFLLSFCLLCHTSVVLLEQGILCARFLCDSNLQITWTYLKFPPGTCFACLVKLQNIFVFCETTVILHPICQMLGFVATAHWVMLGFSFRGSAKDRCQLGHWQGDRTIPGNERWPSWRATMQYQLLHALPEVHFGSAYRKE